jgi:hypothetical protein
MIYLILVYKSCQLTNVAGAFNSETDAQIMCNFLNNGTESIEDETKAAIIKIEVQ